MKAILEFNLPEEQPEFTLAQNGAILHAEVSAFSEWLRRLDKHGLPYGVDPLTLKIIREQFSSVVEALDRI